MNFYRKTKDAVFGGICLGFSEKYNIKCILIRILFLFLFLFSAGILGLIYIILWNFLPSNDSNSTIKEEFIDKIKCKYLKNFIKKEILPGIFFIISGIIIFYLFVYSFLKIIIPLFFILSGIVLIFNFYKKLK